MKRVIAYLFTTFCTWVIFFGLGKVGFMIYNHAGNSFAAKDVVDVLRHGLSMDMSTAGYLLIFPWFVCFLYGFRAIRPRVARGLLVGYAVLAAFLVVAIVCGDCFLYEFWKFKINASIFSYFDNVEGAANSVTLLYIISRIGSIFLASLAVAGLLCAQTRWLASGEKKGKPRSESSSLNSRRARSSFSSWAKAGRVLLMLVVAAVDFLAIRGSISPAVQNVGTAYYSQNLFLNHAAVNPAFSLFSSIKRTENYSEQFQYFDDASCVKALGAEGYPGFVADYYGTAASHSNVSLSAASHPADSLLNSQRPDILIVLMESFGGKFIEELGGIKGVAPNFSRLIHEGIFFDNYYSNSFRTDRGTVSLFSGWVSYPTVSLMRLPQKMAQLPGLGKTLQRVGYETGYLYGGDITVMGKSSYLLSSGFEHLYSDKDFSLAEAESSKWGVCDGLTADRVLQMLTQSSTFTHQSSTPNSQPSTAGRRPWLFGYQTLSSHEPFEVPYNRLEDEKLNAFAYTDECIGKLVDGLKQSPVWDNLLVVLVPDHGFLYDLTYEDPAFFHCPMLWLGGAIREPRRIHAFMNQSDFCATLLAQMGLSSAEYPYSRDALDSHASSFVYCTSPSTVMYADSTGVTVFDVTSQRVITDQGSSAALRLKKAKCILQHSYQFLDEERKIP